MKILVVNGSPKGNISVTVQTLKYLEILFPNQEFSYLNAGGRIKTYEKDFSEAASALKAADLIIFSYPVYTFLVPSQLHRFIELIKENKVDLSGKYVTQLSTSKHFYDVTAHEFIRENCADLSMKYIKGLSADMDDLTTKKGQEDAVSFFKYVLWCVENGIYETDVTVSAESFTENSEGNLKDKARKAATVPENASDMFAEKEEAEIRDDRASESTVSSMVKTGDVVVVCDATPDDENLKRMINRFAAVMPRNIRVVNIHDFKFGGGCISCFNCSTDGTCIYKDGFSDLLRNEIQKAEAIVLAFTIRDHSMGSIFKTYDDRQFCNGHRTVTMGMPFGYIVSGDLSREYNLSTVIKARAEVGGNFLSGIATDEFDPNREIDDLALKLNYAIENKLTLPQNFYGVGGMKIFRDLIWQMQGMMRADHRFYKSHGQYDFPQKRFGRMLLMYPVGSMMANKKLKAKMGSKMTEGMLMPYTKVLDKVRKEAEQKGI